MKPVAGKGKGKDPAPSSPRSAPESEPTTGGATTLGESLNED